ncbi:hypothetical protein BX600DRAFT_460870 [Xylariales sp. PMI_506]|nr:hypothetical protein BX600DRAFT_460870 [Xylariales sp. PMI_506]
MNHRIFMESTMLKTSALVAHVRITTTGCVLRNTGKYYIRMVKRVSGHNKGLSLMALVTRIVEMSKDSRYKLGGHPLPASCSAAFLACCCAIIKSHHPPKLLFPAKVNNFCLGLRSEDFCWSQVILGGRLGSLSRPSLGTKILACTYSLGTKPKFSSLCKLAAL